MESSKEKGAKAAYLWLPLITFDYIWIPLVNFGYLSLASACGCLSLPLLIIPYASQTYVLQHI